ncbi:hypothetical protein FQR65_LT01585 [Abscondita terminalis]|nr:hypothetical protein FQR65_LT01585 [Abscondita terminalis]
MSNLHLRKGSVPPQKVEGKLRLYSMKYCSFAHRVRLVLLVKKIPHDVVNVNIFDKPDWLFTLNPLGEVPILDVGSKIIAQSLDICDYLDKEYPDPPLRSQNADEAVRDQNLIEHFDKMLPTLFEMLRYRTGTSYDEYMEVLLSYVRKYEEELKHRGSLHLDLVGITMPVLGTRYFGGNVPHLVDYIMWPYAERAVICGKLYGKTIPGVDVFPYLYSWCSAMRHLPEVQQTKVNVDYQEVIFKKLRNNDLDIDPDYA